MAEKGKGFAAEKQLGKRERHVTGVLGSRCKSRKWEKWVGWLNKSSITKDLA